MPDRAPREAPLLLLGLVASIALLFACLYWLTQAGALTPGRLELGFVSAFVAAASLSGYAIVRGHLRVRIGLAALGGLAPLTYVLVDAAGYDLGYPAWSSSLLIEVCAGVACAAGSVGLLARKSWARWLALAAALSGIGTGGLNLMGRIGMPSLDAWVYLLAVVFSAIVGLTLLGSSMRAEFESEGTDGVWASREPAVRALRWAVLSQLVATPMLLVYALTQPVVLATRTPALVLALVLGGAAVLAMGRKLAGAVLLVLASPALLVLTAVSAWKAQAMDPQSLQIIGYYACFWLPAGLTSMVAGCVLAKPLVQLWSELGDAR